MAEPLQTHDDVSTEPSTELLALLDSKLDTFEKLELVLALRGAGHDMTLADLAMQLQVGRQELRRVAREVTVSGLIEAAPADCLRLRSGPWDVLMTEAAQILADDPTKLMRALTRISMERLRGRAARTFANAFRIRTKS